MFKRIAIDLAALRKYVAHIARVRNVLRRISFDNKNVGGKTCLQ